MLISSQLGILLLLSACGDDGEPVRTANDGYAQNHPALASQMGMDDADFARYLRFQTAGTEITPDSIKSLSLGSSVNAATSRYNLRPIFDLGRMADDTLIDVDQTRSMATTRIQVASSKSAASSSSQTTADMAVSANVYGVKASVAGHMAQAYQNTSSDGSVSVKMTYANTGTTISVLSSGFSDSQNLTAYLIGRQLSEAELQNMVAVVSDGQCDQRPYITALTVHQYKLSDSEPYANVQLLSRMQDLFAQLKAQHSACSDPAVQASLLTHMHTLRGSIVKAISDFYSYNSDAFVSQVQAMNHAEGIGQLAFDSSSGNAESQYGASVSLKYQSFVASASASASVDYYKQNGWASAVKNTQVEARSQPSNVVDTNGWASALKDMLEKEGTSVVPPLGTLPKNPGVNMPDPVELEKKPSSDPPDSVFSSYADWKQYQADKKAASDEQSMASAEQDVATRSIDDILEDLRLQAGSGDALGELARLLQSAPSSPTLQVGGNLMRMENMYVSGFDVLPYDAVIPQLRPDLDIPGEQKMIDSYPNLMRVLLHMEKFGQLDSYLRYLSNLPVSNVPAAMSERYHRFYTEHAAPTGFNLVSLGLSQGRDISAAMLADYLRTMVGQAESAQRSMLYQALGDMDAWRYVVDTLLEPAHSKIWRTAPGGYMPMRLGAAGQPQLVLWDSINTSDWSFMRGGIDEVVSNVVRTVDYNNPSENPLQLYQGQTLQSPWFPVYIYRQGASPTLVFVQHFGAYQAIYGANWVVQPTAPQDGQLLPPSLSPRWADYDPTAGTPTRPGHLREVISAPENSFAAHANWNFSLRFPQSGEDAARVERFNLLVLPVGMRDQTPRDAVWAQDDQFFRLNTHSVASRNLDFFGLAALKSWTQYAHRNAYNLSPYAAFKVPSVSMLKPRLLLSMETGKAVDVREAVEANYPQHGRPDNYVMLLPINANTVGNQSLNYVANYAPALLSSQLVQSSSIGLVNKLAVLLR